MSVNYQISTNPYTKHIQAEIPVHTQDEIHDIVQNVSQGYMTWSQISLSERIEHLKKLNSEFESHADELARIITQEVGCPLSQTRGEVDKTRSIISYYVEHAPRLLQPKLITDLSNRKQKVMYRPLGVHVHISPYNYPLYLAFRPLIASMLAGNTALLKTPSNTPLLALKIQEIMHKSGLEHVCSVLRITGEHVSRIIEDERVACVSIIGSEKAGISVAQTAGRSIKKSVLELGGSDPFIVFEDADIDEAVKGATFSRLRNAGQSCNAAKRFLIHESIHDEFVSKLSTAFREIKIGDPLDQDTEFSPLISEKSLQAALHMIHTSVQEGARIECGGEVLDAHGYMLAPTILVGVTQDMTVFKEETFAPIAPITSFKTKEDAVSLANNSRFGLGASVWTACEDVAHYCINRIEAGNIFINEIVRGTIDLPYGGVKASGYGRELSDSGMYEFCNITSVSMTYSK